MQLFEYFKNKIMKITLITHWGKLIVGNYCRPMNFEAYM